MKCQTLPEKPRYLQIPTDIRKGGIPHFTFGGVIYQRACIAEPAVAGGLRAFFIKE